MHRFVRKLILILRGGGGERKNSGNLEKKEKKSVTRVRGDDIHWLNSPGTRDHGKSLEDLIEHAGEGKVQERKRGRHKAVGYGEKK